MCIYERVAVLGIIFAGLAGAATRIRAVRLLAVALWIYSAIKGIGLTWAHTMLQLHPDPFYTCEFMARFPQWMPLDKWFPFMFVATGDCADKSWMFLHLSMPQWLLGIFIVYLIVATIVITSRILVKHDRHSAFNG